MLTATELRLKLSVIPSNFIRNLNGGIAKFHYTGPTGPDRTKSAETRVRSGPSSGILPEASTVLQIDILRRHETRVLARGVNVSDITAIGHS